MTAPVVIRELTPDDYPWLLALIDANRAERLSATERASQGFVQGVWNEAALQRLSTGPGLLLAELDGMRAGAALSSPPGAVTDGPAGRTNVIAREVFGADGYFLYGPVIVAAAFRRRGVLRALSAALLARTADRYPAAVAFVQQDNQASLVTHRALGWRELSPFTLEDGRRFVVLSLPTG